MDAKPRPHTCDVCGKTFKQGNQLKQHSDIHLPLEQRPFKCDICEKTFTRSHHLKLHRMVHTRQSPFKCEVCDRYYNQASNLRWHMMVHDASKFQTCGQCGKNFTSKESLEKHEPKHLPKETYQCVYCNKVLLLKTMETHLALHTNGTLIQCFICNKWFVSQDSFDSHITKHTRKANDEHICSFCGRKFRRIGNFENHLITHSGYVPHKCQYCGKTFFQIGSYKRHMELHGGAENVVKIEIKQEEENMAFQDLPTSSNRGVPSDTWDPQMEFKPTFHEFEDNMAFETELTINQFPQ